MPQLQFITPTSLPFVTIDLTFMLVFKYPAISTWTRTTNSGERYFTSSRLHNMNHARHHTQRGGAHIYCISISPANCTPFDLAVGTWAVMVGTNLEQVYPATAARSCQTGRRALSHASKHAVRSRLCSHKNAHLLISKLSVVLQIHNAAVSDDTRQFTSVLENVQAHDSPSYATSHVESHRAQWRSIQLHYHVTT